MVKLSSKKRYSSEEIELIKSCYDKGLKAKQIIRELKKQGFPQRSTSAIHSFVSINIGAHKSKINPEISQIPEPSNNDKDSSRHNFNSPPWTEPEIAIAVKLIIEQNRATNSVRSKLKEQFNIERSATAISQKVHQIRKKGLVDRYLNFPLESYREPSPISPTTTIVKPSTQETLAITDALNDFDAKYLKHVIKDRKELLYKLLKTQADNLKEVDASLKYLQQPTISISDILQNPEKIDEVTEILKMIKKGAIGPNKPINAEIITFANYAKKPFELVFLLPLYIQDVLTSSDTLRSKLDSAMYLSLIDNSVGINPVNQDQNIKRPFKDLTKYVVLTNSEEVNLKPLESKINEIVQDKYKTANIRISQDPLSILYQLG